MGWPIDDDEGESTLPQEVLDDPDPDHMWTIELFPIDPDDPAWLEDADEPALEIIEAAGSA
jgi:hypothetical protein